MTTPSREQILAIKRLRSRISTLQGELNRLINHLSALSEKGPPPVDTGCPIWEQDRSFAPVLEDGVLVNAAALWPVLEPLWKDPKKWWAEIARGGEKKDFDWSFLAGRYWPERVTAKCRADASVATAHKYLWSFHPQKARVWKLRMQQKLGPMFLLEEPGHETFRAACLPDLSPTPPSTPQKDPSSTPDKAAPA